MIKLSKLTDYAVVILGSMATQVHARQTATELSQLTGLPEPTVAKVLKLLARGGLIISSRGMNGGYSLAHAPEQINMASVITALDGPVALTSCCVEGGEESCSMAQGCNMKGKWNPVNDAMHKALENVTLAQMIGGNA